MPTVAERLGPFIDRLVGPDPGVAISFWDGSEVGGGKARIEVRSPIALRRLIYGGLELGLARGFVAGDIVLAGSIFEVLALRDRLAAPERDFDLRLGATHLPKLLRAAAACGAVGPPPAPPPEEVRLRGRLHSKRRDASAVSHHYDVSNDFYRLVLGPTMTYSCAYFRDDGFSLDQAQEAKYELVCGKLGLRPGMRLLDVGCGWGGMLLHAAGNHGVEGVGVTLSRAQADLASKRIAEAGLADRIEIRFQDYRDVVDGPFDAISSIGMFEHVGLSRLNEYFDRLFALLRPEGRLLNHGISRPSGRAGFDKRSFINRYVFPDGELLEVGRVVSALQSNHFEVRDVESLREHYALTLRAWIANLERNWDECVALVGARRARVWQLYMAGSALGFEAGRINVHQVLAVRPSPGGGSGMSLDRANLIYEPRA